MLNYKLINYKPLINVNGVAYQDLLSETFNKEAYYTPQLLIVNEYYVARPDLISLAMYGDDKYADIICKINGISNPFELNENDILMIPNIEYLNECISKNRNPSELIKNPKTDTIQKVDSDNMQKRKNENRSPNEQVYGDSNYVIDKSLGLVFY